MPPRLDAYPLIHRIENIELATEDDLRLIIATFPLLDGHAHNLLRSEYADGGAEYPFECITSEAQGHALHDHGSTTLAHMRGIKQLAEFFRCPETLEDVKAARSDWILRDYGGLIKKCFEGVHAIMMDDGLSQDIIQPGKWHRQFVPRVSRIVRIESIAAEMLEHLAQSAGFMKVGLDGDWPRDQTEVFLSRFNTMFRNQIKTLAQDPHVRGFKSVVCYRSGLDIGLETKNFFRPHHSLTDTALLSSFHAFLTEAVREHKFRVEQKDINDFLVVAVCDVLERMVLEQSIETNGENLPFQFHTGLGDNDIDLVKANPAYMQPLIEAFPNVDFVILHASWPYTRSAAYLAATYSNVWLDIGEAFPMLSRNGEESVLRQALELAPTSKIMWSSDGHFYPESYWLANKQFRAALDKVLLEYVLAGDLSVIQAVDIAVDIMFWNSNALYKLDEQRRYPQLLKACGRASAASVKTLTNSGRPPSQASRASTIASPRPSTMMSAHQTMLPTSTSPIQRFTTEPLVAGISSQNINAFDAVADMNPPVKYIWVQAIDFTGTLRQRMVPIAQAKRHVDSKNYPGITAALPRILQNDTCAEGTVATGEIKLIFDLSSLSPNKGITSPSASVQTWWMSETDTSKHHYACPRWALQSQLNILKHDYNIDMLMGFEIEVIYVRPKSNAAGNAFDDFEVLHSVHAWSSMSYTDLDYLPMVEETVNLLAEAGIQVPQFHCEAAPGQWEFPLPAFSPVRAVDVLYRARDVVRHVARKHGLKATFYPRPYSYTCGSAAHTHFSINGPGDIAEKYTDPFIAGVLQNLPSILAFSLPISESYERVLPGIWAGGEYVAWGTQNRETSLRRCLGGHWELKSIDGIGNMYLTMAALMASGLSGIQTDAELTMQDCPVSASILTPEQRSDLGITTLLPKTLEESLDNLDGNQTLRSLLGAKLIDDYIDVKKAEANMLGAMSDEKRRAWLIARY